MAADLVKHDRPAVIWCHLNVEGDTLEKMIPGAVQVSGADSDDEKESAFNRFSDGTTRVLIIKPKIGAHGLNWQHCAHVVTFASHSYEQYYQSVRRCWRFGQKNKVRVDIISASGETHVRDNMRRKSEMAGAMFENLVRHMNNALQIERKQTTVNKVKLPKWI
jgi:superfamily II DNA or RNA helicase